MGSAASSSTLSSRPRMRLRRTRDSPRRRWRSSCAGCAPDPGSACAPRCAASAPPRSGVDWVRSVTAKYSRNDSVALSAYWMSSSTSAIGRSEASCRSTRSSARTASWPPRCPRSAPGSRRSWAQKSTTKSISGREAQPVQVGAHRRLELGSRRVRDPPEVGQRLAQRLERGRGGGSAPMHDAIRRRRAPRAAPRPRASCPRPPRPRAARCARSAPARSVPMSSKSWRISASRPISGSCGSSAGMFSDGSGSSISGDSAPRAAPSAAAP